MTSQTKLAALLRNFLPRFAPGLARSFVKLTDPYVIGSYSQEGEDMVVRRIFDGVKNGFYVDVGAHHPMRFSNTCYFHQHGWRGINIDADPNAITAFRRERPKDINLAVGVSDEPGTLDFHAFSDPALNTFDSQLAAERAVMPGYRRIAVFEIGVRCLAELLDEHLPPNQRIHLLNVDAEGFDLKVLQSNDWVRYRPQCVLVEALQASFEDLRSSDVHCFMQAKNYRLFAKGVKTLIYVDAEGPGQ